MHVAVDAQNLLADRRGIGVYLRAVLSRMLKSEQCELTLLVRHPLPTLRKRALAAELGSAAFSVSSRIPRHADVAWHPWNGTFFRGASRNVVTMHDVVPFAFPAENSRKRTSQQRPFEVSAATANCVIADSEFTKEEIQHYLRVDAQRIDVVWLAAGEIFSPGRPSELPNALRERPYILYVGTLEERKNLPTLVAAWRRSLAARRVALVTVGAGQIAEGVVSRREAGLEQMRDLYRGALCVAVPSLYEGFGLPALEAMSCGAPTVVSRTASLPEVCGDAAYYVDEPRNVDAWEKALDAIASSAELRQTFSQRGLERAKMFSWDRTAEATLSILSEAAGER